MLSDLERTILSEFGDDVQQLVRAIGDLRNQAENDEATIRSLNDEIGDLKNQIDDLEK